jgi:hypothetical protein
MTYAWILIFIPTLLFLPINRTYGQVDLTTELLLQRSGNGSQEQNESANLSETSRMKRQVREESTVPMAPNNKKPQPNRLSESPTRSPKQIALPPPYTDVQAVQTKPVDVENAVQNPNVPEAESVKEGQSSQPTTPIDSGAQQTIPSQPLDSADESFAPFKLPLKMGIALTPFFFINDAQSNYWSRSYLTNGSGYGLGVSVEVLESWDFNFLSRSTLTTTMTENPNAVGITRATYYDQQFRAGPRLLFTDKQQASVGLAAYVKGLSLPKVSTNRISTHSEGAGVFFETIDLLKSNSKFQLQFFPQILHRELKNSSSSIKSGKFDTGHAASVLYSKMQTIGNHSKLEYGLQYWFEKQIFKGAVGAPDPLSGDSPSGVEVTDQTLTIFMNLTWSQ